MDYSFVLSYSVNNPESLETCQASSNIMNYLCLHMYLRSEIHCSSHDAVEGICSLLVEELRRVVGIPEEVVVRIGACSRQFVAKRPRFRHAASFTTCLRCVVMQDSCTHNHVLKI